MRRALDIAVIADDITGAADTGVQFCPTVGPVHMAGAVDGEFSAAGIQTAGVAVFTNTRNTDATRAAEMVRMAAEKIRSLGPRLIYKKIDSCLRGNLGAEIDALLQATGAVASFVAPAFPQQGRTTIHDCHLINGVAVAETEIGRDPLCPVRESRLSALLSTQSRMTVGHVDLACIETGSVELAERVRILLNQGCRHIAFDAAQAVHLDAIASLSRDHFQNILLVGSAGLAGSLARIMARDRRPPEMRDRPKIKKWLLVCGSASRVLADQVTALARFTGWPCLPMDPLVLTLAKESVQREQVVAELVDAWDAGGLILCLRPILDARPTQHPKRVVQGLAEVVSSLLTVVTPQGIFLSGGDTAEAVWHQLGASALLIREEILPGLMRGEFSGGRADGLPVVTKAGAFGHADTLRQLIISLK